MTTEMRYFERAREAIDLAGFITSIYGKPSFKSSHPRWDMCPHCGESSKGSAKLVVRKGHYKCFSCANGGSVVDFAAAMKGVSPDEAAKWLLNEPVLPIYQRGESVADNGDDEIRMLRASDVVHDLRAVLCANRNQDVLRYLHEERCIPVKVLREAVDRKILGFLPSNPREAHELLVDIVGEQRLREAGFWKEGKKLAGIAYRPLVLFLNAGSAEFRVIGNRLENQAKAIRYGVTNSPFFWGGSSGKTKVVEGAIDMLSEVALNGSDDNIVGLPGCNNWEISWFEKLQAAGRALSVEVRLDNDVNRANGRNPGQEWAVELIKALGGIGIRAINTSPEVGDVNDVLKAKRGSQAAA